MRGENRKKDNTGRRRKRNEKELDGIIQGLYIFSGQKFKDFSGPYFEISRIFLWEFTSNQQNVLGIQILQAYVNQNIINHRSDVYHCVQ